MTRFTRRMLPVLVTAVSVVGVTAAPALAAKQTKHKVTGVSSVLTPSAAGLKFLTDHHITVSALGAASLANGSLTLPISGGVVKTPSLDGTLVQKGGVKFTLGKRSVSLRGIVAHRIGKVAFVTAFANGHELIVARVAKATVSITGKSAVATGELKLSAEAARLLNRAFGKHVAGAGVDIGSFKSIVTVA